jgi:TRAP-type C4-dicarboxylate transport system substrate-binding protein
MNFGKHFLAAGLAAAMVLTVSSAGAQQKWDMVNEYGATSLMGRADKHFSDLVKESTQGAVEVANQYGGALGIKSNSTLKAVGAGAVQLGNFPIQAAAGDDPLFLVSNLPFIVSTPKEAFIFQDVMRPYIAARVAKQGARLLYLSNWPSAGIWSKNPVATLADLKGAKIRTNDVMSTDVFRRAGAFPLQISWSDVIPQIQTGALSMVNTSSAGGISIKMWEMLPAYTDIGMMLAANAAIINEEAFQKLSKDQQAKVTEAAAKTEQWLRQEYLAEIKKDETTMKQNNVKLLTVDQLKPGVLAEFQARSSGLIDDWLKKTGADGQALLSEYLKRTGKKL